MDLDDSDSDDDASFQWAVPNPECRIIRTYPRTNILHALEELENDDFTIRFQRQLSLKTMGGVKRIPRYRLENKSREETVDLMVQAYTEEGAVAVAVETLQLIRQHYAANKLLDRYPTAGKRDEQGTKAQEKKVIQADAAFMRECACWCDKFTSGGCNSKC